MHPQLVYTPIQISNERKSDLKSQRPLPLSRVGPKTNIPEWPIQIRYHRLQVRSFPTGISVKSNATNNFHAISSAYSNYTRYFTNSCLRLGIVRGPLMKCDTYFPWPSTGSGYTYIHIYECSMDMVMNVDDSPGRPLCNKYETH